MPVISLSNQGWLSLSLVFLVLLEIERPPKEHDVRLRSVNRIVHPSPALLNPYCTPFTLHQRNNKIDIRMVKLKLELKMIKTATK